MTISVPPACCLFTPRETGAGETRVPRSEGKSKKRMEKTIPAPAGASRRPARAPLGTPELRRRRSSRSLPAGRLGVPLLAARLPSPLRSRSPALTGRRESRARAGGGGAPRLRGCSKIYPSRQSPGAGIS